MDSIYELFMIPRIKNNKSLFWIVGYNNHKKNEYHRKEKPRAMKNDKVVSGLNIRINSPTNDIQSILY